MVSRYFYMDNFHVALQSLPAMLPCLTHAGHTHHLSRMVAWIDNAKPKIWVIRKNEKLNAKPKF
ncbi:MAG: hypothetical protein A2033_12945 [Bacteroidetes bacterium GWA2_31_9]|nr:MAG: hypothetical protein A2033_12945 [Bacteroidetes bacterium GWA2_31_9]